MMVIFADPTFGGTPPVDTSTTGICRTDEMQEWGLLAQWNLQSDLGLLSWDMGEELVLECTHK